MPALGDLYLSHLGLEPVAPSREFLDAIIERHQVRVPFETLSKLIDSERLRRDDEWLPDMRTWIERIVGRGAGGTCWTMARGLRWLLTELGFDAQLIYMDRGHLCVHVQLDRAYYADVGYAAPLFRAYPIDEAFVVDADNERFEYAPRGDGFVDVRRAPGPDKVLDVRPRTLGEFDAEIRRANEWHEESFLTRLVVFTWVDGVHERFYGDHLLRFPATGMVREELDDAAAESWIERVGVDLDLYREAREIRLRGMSEHGIDKAFSPT